MKNGFALLVAALFVLIGSTARAQDTSPAPTSFRFTHEDISQLLKAVDDADKSPDITINVLAKAPGEMRAYDSIVHYAGIDTTNHEPTIWISNSLQKGAQATTAWHSVMLFAVMDSGFAGKQWKALYDELAARDAAQPAGTDNPYRFRLQFTIQLHWLIAKGGNTDVVYCPSPAPTGQ